MVSFWFSLKSEMPPYLKWGREEVKGKKMQRTIFCRIHFPPLCSCLNFVGSVNLNCLHRQPFCLLAFLYCGDGFGNCVLYNIMNLRR